MQESVDPSPALTSKSGLQTAIDGSELLYQTNLGYTVTNDFAKEDEQSAAPSFLFKQPTAATAATVAPPLLSLMHTEPHAMELVVQPSTALGTRQVELLYELVGAGAQHGEEKLLQWGRGEAEELLVPLSPSQSRLQTRLEDLLPGTWLVCARERGGGPSAAQCLRVVVPRSPQPDPALQPGLIVLIILALSGAASLLGWLLLHAALRHRNHRKQRWRWSAGPRLSPLTGLCREFRRKVKRFAEREAERQSRQQRADTATTLIYPDPSQP